MSTKPLTISLQNLNTLYCKYLEQYILQYLPKNILNDVNIILGMKSAIETYKYLDNKLNNIHNDNNNSQYDVLKNNQRKSSHSKNNSGSMGSIGIEKDNINTLIDRRAYLQDEKEKQTNKRINSLLKRANTYAQRPQENKFQPLSNITQKVDNKQQQNNQLTQQGSIKRVHSHTHSTSHISITPYHHQQQQSLSTSENRYYQSPQYKRQNTKKRQQDKQIDRKNNSLGLRTKAQGQSNFHKEKYHNNHTSNNNNNNNNTSSQNGGSMGKIQFAKTYSTRQVLNQNNNTTNHTYLSKHPPTINRNKLLTLIKQTRQIFTDNSKKIIRYDNLSSDLAAMQHMQQQHHQIGKSQKINDEMYKLTTSNNSYVNSNSNGNSNSNSYGYNVIGGKKY